MLIGKFQHLSSVKGLELRQIIVEVHSDVSDQKWSYANQKPRRWTAYRIAILKIEKLEFPPPRSGGRVKILWGGGPLCHLPTSTSVTFNLLYFGPQRQKSNKLDSPLRTIEKIAIILQ